MEKNSINNILYTATLLESTKPKINSALQH